MGNTPFKGEIKNLTNDVISSIELNAKLEGVTDRGKPINAYRVDKLVLLIKSHAGLATGDYIIAQCAYMDLNGDALADLLGPASTDYIEQQMLGVVEMLGTNGPFTLKYDPAKQALTLRFENCFIIKSKAYMNILAHGLASERDSEYEIWGQYVSLKKSMLDRLDKGTVL